MALIICQECGKKVSDTAANCIHCGAPIVVEKLPEATTPVQNQQKTPTEGTSVEIQSKSASAVESEMTNFNSLGDKKQEELVHAFWEEDPIAKRYQKKRLIMDRLAQRFSGYAFLPIAFYLLIQFALKLPLQNGKMIIPLLGLFLVYYVLSTLKLLVFSIIKRLTVTSKPKRLAYEKRFATWVMEKHQIVYYPIFIHAKDKLMYEQINIDTFKL